MSQESTANGAARPKQRGAGGQQGGRAGRPLAGEAREAEQMAMVGEGMRRSGERTRRGRVESERDREVLAWIGRFRFVTSELLAQRFKVSVQQMRARVRRLEQLGDVHRALGLRGQAAAIYLTPAGAARVGSRRHRAPRPDTHRDHELALVGLVIELEQKAPPGLSVLTERDARDLESDGGRRYSVDVRDGHGSTSRRWPDVILTTTARTVALEVEFADKSSRRLRAILDAYLTSELAEVRFLVGSPTLAARLTRLANDQTREIRAFHTEHCRITIAAYSGVDDQTRLAIRERLQTLT